MVDKSSPLFDFTPYLAQREEVLGLIREFASHHAFRSAAVEELQLDEDFYRRPLRPEDLEFLQFKKAVPAERVSRLPALATQRLLMALNEVGVARDQLSQPNSCALLVVDDQDPGHIAGAVGTASVKHVPRDSRGPIDSTAACP